MAGWFSVTTALLLLLFLLLALLALLGVLLLGLLGVLLFMLLLLLNLSTLLLIIIIRCTLPYGTKTTADTTVVHKPRSPPVAVCTIARVRTILPLIR